ncbi:hypothetical protein AQ915_20645 [Burkholderia pseudomallei]|uniref:hypothetical protein n=1 Tax=Burkholderia pseudomallei TaxID=28450 RepID=UPI000975E4C9|nr:hypothetical protein [Burkholderia pseudomallei]ONC30065.1 hypothetical protein AQ915_20645 [Burkholderia pseudomallei]
MTSIARTTRRRAQRRHRHAQEETAYLLRSDANAAFMAASIAQLRRAKAYTTVPQEILKRAMQDNPDLPVAFVADTLAGMAEARARASMAAAWLAGLGGSEPGITAGRRRR